jgi:hypothetical protein
MKDHVTLADISRLFAELSLGIDKVFTNSRERSLAFTKLQESQMWLNRAELNTPSPSAIIDDLAIPQDDPFIAPEPTLD